MAQRQRKALLWLVPLAVLAFAAGAEAAKKTKSIEDRCEGKVHKKLKTEHPEVREIQLTHGGALKQPSAQASIAGTGMLIASDNKLRHFTWTCTYDASKDKIVHVDYGKLKKKKK